MARRTTHLIGRPLRRRNAGALVPTLLIVSACGGDAAPGADRADVESVDDGAPIPDEPGGASPAAVEPGSGTEVVLAPPETVSVDEPIEIPLTLRVHPDEGMWDEAFVDVAAEGQVAARSEIDVAALAGGGSTTGDLVIDVERGADPLSRGTVTVTMELRSGGDVVTARVNRLHVLADADTAYLGFGSIGDLERAMLLDLLEAGEISQREYDRAHAATLEKITGSVEVVEDG